MEDKGHDSNKYTKYVARADSAVESVLDQLPRLTERVRDVFREVSLKTGRSAAKIETMREDLAKLRKKAAHVDDQIDRIIFEASNYPDKVAFEIIDKEVVKEVEQLFSMYRSIYTKWSKYLNLGLSTKHRDAL